jgi:hypothetical protein
MSDLAGEIGLFHATGEFAFCDRPLISAIEYTVAAIKVTSHDERAF